MSFSTLTKYGIRIMPFTGVKIATNVFVIVCFSFKFWYCIPFDDIEKIISVKLKQIINDNTHVIIFFLNSNVLNLFQIKINNLSFFIITTN